MIRPSTGRPAATARRTFAALGTTAVLVVTDVARVRAAERRLRSILADIDRACSRFRTDSEISRLHARAGTTVTVTPLLAQALAAALRAAEVSGGLVDPTVGTAVRALGYDRDFAAIAPDSPTPVGPTRPAPAWRRIRFDPSTRCLLVPRGIDLDLGAHGQGPRRRPGRRRHSGQPRMRRAGQPRRRHRDGRRTDGRRLADQRR